MSNPETADSPTAGRRDVVSALLRQPGGFEGFGAPSRGDSGCNGCTDTGELVPLIRAFRVRLLRDEDRHPPGADPHRVHPHGPLPISSSYGPVDKGDWPNRLLRQPDGFEGVLPSREAAESHDLFAANQEVDGELLVELNVARVASPQSGAPQPQKRVP
jgi:hypothetical protein